MVTQASTQFADLLRRYRKNAGLTQQELAKRARLSARAISDLERGVNHAPRVDTLALIAEALELSADERAALEATVRRRRRPSARQAKQTISAAPSVSWRLILPIAPTSLLGRENDEAAIIHLLHQEETRLLTLVGPAGVGKTRLALRVAELLASRYADGAVVVSLAASREPDLIAPAIARALKLRDDAAGTPRDLLRGYLRERQMLLVLDNFEQVVSAATLLADLLAACPRLKILVTSRVALRLRNEQEFPVLPLALPDPRRVLPLREVAQYPAVALFVQRAQAARPDFALTEENVTAIVAICRRLDGVPLALELAAPRLKLFAPSLLLARLEESPNRLTTEQQPALRLLTGGARDHPERLQTMRGAIAWSYDLLSLREQVLLRRLAVFAQSCTLEAAAAICHQPGAAPPDALEILDGVTLLVDQSMLRPLGIPADGDAEDAPRFGMLEVVREFALERLTESGESAALCRQHALYFAALAEEAEPRLRGTEQRAWLRRLEHEHDNFQAVLQWACQSADAAELGDAAGGRRNDLGLRVASALWRYWQMRGYLAAGRAWLDRLLALDAGEREERPALEAAQASVRANALNAAGVLAFAQGDYERAATLHEEGLAICRSLGARQGIADALTNLGNVALRRRDYGRATALYQDSVAVRRELGDTWGTATTLNNLGVVARAQADYERAAALYEESLALHRALGDRSGMGLVLNNLGEIARDLGNLPRAISLAEESVALHRRLGDKGRLALTLTALGDMERDQGKVDRAVRLYAESLTLCRDIGDRWSLAEALSSLGRALAAQGDWPQATARYQESIALYQAFGDMLGVAYCLEGLAVVAVSCGQAAWAATLYAAAATLRETLGTPHPPADRAAHEHAIAAMRTMLGEPAFTAAWAEGQGTALTQVIAEALRFRAEQGGGS